MALCITPNEFLEAVETFTNNGRNLSDFVQFQYPKKDAKLYLNIRFFINGRYQKAYMICRSLIIKYGIQELQQRNANKFYKPTLCFDGDSTFEYTKKGENTTQHYGLYRLKLHEILQAKKDELKLKYPKLTSIETSIQLEKEDKETGHDEELEIPIIKTKFQIVGKNKESATATFDIEIKDVNNAKIISKNGTKKVIFPDFEIENDDGDIEPVNNGNLHKVFTKGSPVSYLEDISQGLIFTNGKIATFYLLATLCSNSFINADKKVYVRTNIEEYEIDDEDIGNIAGDLVIKEEEEEEIDESLFEI